VRLRAPPFSRRGARGSKPLEAGGWLVKGRVATLYVRVALLILFEITNHSVCAAKERDLFISGAATPPLKGGEWDPQPHT
jgi:hypothetical protein